MSDSQPEYVELPRPMRLLRTAGVSLAESFGLPTGGYALAAWLAGRDAGLWTLLGVIWLTAGIRLLVTTSVPTLVLISLIMLTVQTVATIATGNLLIFLAHFPLADLGLCLFFARTARKHTPLAARLAAEVIGLRSPAVHQPRLHPGIVVGGAFGSCGNPAGDAPAGVPARVPARVPGREKWQGDQDGEEDRHDDRHRNEQEAGSGHAPKAHA